MKINGFLEGGFATIINNKKKKKLRTFVSHIQLYFILGKVLQIMH